MYLKYPKFVFVKSVSNMNKYRDYLHFFSVLKKRNLNSPNILVSSWNHQQSHGFTILYFSINCIKLDIMYLAGHTSRLCDKLYSKHCFSFEILFQQELSQKYVTDTFQCNIMHIAVEIYWNIFQQDIYDEKSCIYKSR